MSGEQNAVAPAAPVNESVTNRILRSFVDSLEKQDGMAEIAGRLRAEVVDKPGRSEVIIRLALFGVDAL
jgi:hypothetical protein